MKKVASLICLLLMLLTMALPVSAKETAPAEDSITISDEILSCLDEGTVDTIFRVYVFNDACSSFVKYGDIDGVLANATARQLRIYYFVKNKQDEIYYYYTYDGTNLSKTERHSDWGSGWFGIHSEKKETILKKVFSDIVTENVYYLWYDSWFAVYYKTNLGDYVYIRSEKKEYLMGLDQFVAMQNVIHDRYEHIWDRRAGMLGPGIVVTIESAPVDMSPYDITSPDFDPHAPFKTMFSPGKVIAIGSFVLLLALLVCRILICNHRKRRKREDIPVNRL